MVAAIPLSRITRLGPGCLGSIVRRNMISITPRDTKFIAWISLVLGAFATVAGIAGIWLQGSFYRGGFPTAATFSEVSSAFTWPAGFTAFGCMTVAAVLLSSSATSSWSSRRRMSVFLVFGVTVLIACAVSGHLAAMRVATILR